jgi:hypothetical protein
VLLAIQLCIQIHYFRQKFNYDDDDNNSNSNNNKVKTVPTSSTFLTTILLLANKWYGKSSSKVIIH